MGPGGSQEAEFTLLADVPAGTYHLVCDAIIIRAIDVRFELIWRQAGMDTVIAIHDRHFEPLAGGAFKAQPCEVDLDATEAIVRGPGDQLVFRYSGSNSTSTTAFIPNGDGALADGRIPNITIP